MKQLGRLMMVLALTASGVAVYVVSKPSPVQGAGQVLGFSAPVRTFTTAPTKLAVSILKGGQTGCLATGGCHANNYTQRLGRDQGWNLSVFPQGGTGYLAGRLHSPPTNFAARLPLLRAAKPGLVIIEGSSSDRSYRKEEVRAAATALYAAIRAALPSSKIVVVGPIWSGVPSADTLAASAAIKAAALGHVDLFIDPIAEGWFRGVYGSLVAEDHESPTDAGHARMAQLIARDLAPLRLQTGN